MSRGRRILGAGVRTLGRGLWQAVRRGDRTRHWARVGEDWFQTLGELKGAAMKLGQIASQYRDLLPEPLAEQLSRLQFRAEPVPWETLRHELDTAWTPSQRGQIESIQTTALASASIGQVHLARMADGRKLAIKIRYPGVADAMDADIVNLGRVLRAAGALPIDKASLDELLLELRARLVEEMDYGIELANLQAFLALPSSPGLIFPKPLPELCTESVLVTEFLEGEDLEVARHWPQELRDEIGARYVDWFLRQYFEHGLLHADPHPGNFRFRRDGSIVVFDFGCVKRIRKQDQELIAEQLHASLAGDWEGVHRTLADLGSLARPELPMGADLQALYEQFGEYFSARMLAEPHFDFSDAAFIPEARDMLKTALPHWRRFKPVPEMAFVTRAMSGAYWLLRRLGARVPLRARVRALAR